ncbi:hypothetical protein Ga0074812_101154 [Parafrankia irregularis]|uniref:Uncharacterized protein n=1 Tax=Parafrankia irregularis TaxID=795642 RepID=A0A0S4QG03_9ACTN|nr:MULTISPECIES: hypothetical protein [Parafrankia]MBE3199675.1 hypothetical protein [Parafrankia sp. CH37]CUU53656.1 hypothetical protein Ga0074812_101154 [Parafrankia irregularis]
MAMRQVKVMADYYAFPLWTGDGMLSPEALPLTDGLRDELALWSAEYTRTLSDNGYDWPNEQVQADWNGRGYALAVRVAQELGPSYEVVFFDELRQCVTALNNTAPGRTSRRQE